ncbi:MAG: agmatinase [Candidatus Margulisbacteria bacterium]|nr:agmatinase [Candidatus Margulisiibacteriota bacterium]MBU1022409.1 agmatinase [Candidatus Margulisiibacteriota bacterium]MBU1729039.1 agmatinase [Candidatus Margulisiibacteriota bacterium]MBU1954540.1 agmatinase [Candidatus Margulisiibacteriota bacterium]
MSSFAEAKFVILPVPYEATTSYGQGTKAGPAAILKALDQVEEFNHEFQFDAWRKDGIYIQKALSVANTKRLPVNQIKTGIQKILSKGKIPIMLGGEHSIAMPAVEIAKKHYPKLTVLQIDSHADLRSKYMGDKDSHATVMRKILDICPAVQVGIRNISEEGYQFAKESGQLKKIHFAEKKLNIRKVLRQLSRDVYITFDVDALDSAEMPSTGTPEPGGFYYRQVLELIKAVAKKKNIVGMDVVELMPIKGLHAPDFLVAKLIYQAICYISYFSK